MSKYVIGLTGGIACGKSNLSRALREQGVHVIDADAISHSLTADGGPALPAIRQAFGDQVFDGDSLNRRTLANLVFSDEDKRKTLNGILHPMVLAEIRREIGAEEAAVVLDVPLLFETGMDSWCDEIWCAYVPQKIQIQRVMKRDGVSGREAVRRIRSQMPVREKCKRSRHVIRTDGSKENSAALVLSLWRQIQGRIEGERL